jgi:hypothetical protein
MKLRPISGNYKGKIAFNGHLLVKFSTKDKKFRVYNGEWNGRYNKEDGTLKVFETGSIMPTPPFYEVLLMDKDECHRFYFYGSLITDAARNITYIEDNIPF